MTPLRLTYLTIVKYGRALSPPLLLRRSPLLLVPCSRVSVWALGRRSSRPLPRVLVRWRVIPICLLVVPFGRLNRRIRCAFLIARSRLILVPSRGRMVSRISLNLLVVMYGIVPIVFIVWITWRILMPKKRKSIHRMIVRKRRGSPRLVLRLKKSRMIVEKAKFKKHVYVKKESLIPCLVASPPHKDLCRGKVKCSVGVKTVHATVLID